MRLSRLIASALIATTTLPLSVMGQDYRYAVIELARLTESYQWAGASAVNSYGDVVGYTSTEDHTIHAALWPRDGGVIDLGTLGGRYSGALEINDNGEICGWAVADPNGNILDTRAFLWRESQMLDLGTLGGENSYAFALNDSAQVVGEAAYELNSGRRKAFVWADGKIQTLPAPHPDWDGRAAFGINNQGDIVGYGLNLAGEYTGLLWRNGEVIELGSLGGQGTTEALSINDTGVAVGSSVALSGQRHAVKWINGQIADIHTPAAGSRSEARGVNALGQIVGDNAQIPSRALILNPGEDWIALDDLVPPRLRLNWRMQRATHINDAGQIPVEEAVADSDYWALLLTPVNPTMAMQSPLPGSAGTTNRLRVTGVTPGARVTFLYSRHGGGTRIPGCDLQQNALQLDNPTVIGTAIANQQGVATITRPVPLIARGQTILFQAVVQNECAISQLVVHQFD